MTSEIEASAAEVVAGSPDAGRLMRRATYASASVATVLVLVKAGAWFATDAVAMLSSLVDSLLDAFASLLTLFAVHHALVPADREHRFGHGKAEPLAALGQAAFVTGSAILLAVEAGVRLLRPRPIEHGDIGIAVMVFSIVMTIGLVLYQRHVIRRSGSVAITADSIHYRGDLLMNLLVILALVLAPLLEFPQLDPLFGLGIAAFLMHGAWRIVQTSLDMLLDRELPDEERAQIRGIALANPAVVAVHELRSRQSGPTRFIQLHLVLDGAMSLKRAHRISDEVEQGIMEAFPNAEVIIHQDPEGEEEEHPVFR
ncbi:MAG: cation diffusion facilitator family transporter [Alphaproteobacteria bacterium]